VNTFRNNKNKTVVSKMSL